MTGIDIPIEECKLIIHQPSIKEISYIGELDFLTGVQTFCIKKNVFMLEGKNLLEDMNNFEIFMTIMSAEEAAEKKISVQKMLKLFFPDYQVMITPRSLVFIKDGQESVMVDENNFDFLQDAIFNICCLGGGPGGGSAEVFNPADKKAREIAEKLMRGRRRVAAQNPKGGNGSIFV
jgi:hypothetical protein